MKTTTGITLVAIGAILSFAISLNTGFISLQIVGIVLMLTGIAGLCLSQRGTGLLGRQLAALRYLLAQDASVISGKRVPLDDLLRTAAPSSCSSSTPTTAARPWQHGEAVSDDSAVEDSAVQDSGIDDATIEETPTSPDIWATHRAPQGVGARGMAL